MANIAPQSTLAVVSLALIRVSFLLGIVGFLLGATGGVLAVIAVHTGRDQQLDIRVYPVGRDSRRVDVIDPLQSRETPQSSSLSGLWTVP
jgi:hypothetical protein